MNSSYLAILIVAVPVCCPDVIFRMYVPDAMLAGSAISLFVNDLLSNCSLYTTSPSKFISCRLTGSEKLPFILNIPLLGLGDMLNDLLIALLMPTLVLMIFGALVESMVHLSSLFTHTVIVSPVVKSTVDVPT